MGCWPPQIFMDKIVMSYDPFQNVVFTQEISQCTWVELIVVKYDIHGADLRFELNDPKSFDVVRNMALACGVDPTLNEIFKRPRSDSKIYKIDWNTPVISGLSVVAIPLSMSEDRLAKVKYMIEKTQAVLPLRMIWPTNS